MKNICLLGASLYSMAISLFSLAYIFCATGEHNAHTAFAVAVIGLAVGLATGILYEHNHNKINSHGNHHNNGTV